MAVTKKRIKHGNGQALVIGKAIIAAAEIDESALHLLTVNPNVGLIESIIDSESETSVEASCLKLNEEYKDWMQHDSLASIMDTAPDCYCSPFSHHRISLPHL